MSVSAVNDTTKTALLEALEDFGKNPGSRLSASRVIDKMAEIFVSRTIPDPAMQAQRPLDKIQVGDQAQHQPTGPEETKAAMQAQAVPIDGKMSQLFDQLARTLDHLKIGRAPLSREMEELWKILKGGVPLEELMHAISGMRFEAKTQTYDPAKHFSIFKLHDPERRIKMVSLSTQEKERRSRARPIQP